MRTRKILVVIAMAAALTGCSGEEAGPKPAGGGVAVSPQALATKLRALTVDTCYTEPNQQSPAGCQKYVTELASTVGMVRQQASPDHPNLNSLADALNKGIGDYRAGHCDSVATAGDPCTPALLEISAAVHDIKQVIDQVAGG